MTDERRPFVPHRPSTRAQRLAVFLVLAPLLWVIALEALGFAVRRGDAVLVGLLIASVSFVLSLAVLVPLRWSRVREERRAPAQ